MDVISLLNSNGPAAAAEQQQQQKEMEITRTPTRNRTPWDAGGYSLPINTMAMAPTPVQQVHMEDLQLEEGHTPTSTKHKFSDSRSSLSSFTSSLYSTTHSRYSSMSTVNSAHHMNGATMDSLLPKIIIAPHPLELTTIDSMSDTRPSNSLSPTGSLDALAFVAEHHTFSQPPAESSGEIMELVSSEGDLRASSTGPRGPRRPSSPSDAILIKRTAVPRLRVNTGDADLVRAGPQYTPIFSSAPLGNSHLSFAHPRSQHKRSSSAPDFLQAHRPLAYRTISELNSDPNMGRDADASPDFPVNQTSTQLNMSNIGRDTSMSHKSPLSHTSGMLLIDHNIGQVAGPHADPTPPSSHHPDQPSPTSASLFYPAPDTPPSANADAEEDTQIQLRCMFVQDCDTNSTLRKAISHIFGRNKMCTRLIPSRVWVHYCRKHYQRSRYRNPKEYAKLQCDLVQEQIRRIHDWSERNSAAGQPGVVQDWGLAIRKREAKRIEELEGTKRKRGVADLDDDDGDKALVFTPPTAVPKWLQNDIGKGYSTTQILEIFNKLHAQVLDDKIPQFPDIEILPNITTEKETPKSPKGYARRTLATPSHRRSQSLGVSTTHDYSTPDRRMSQPLLGWSSSSDGGVYGSPIPKRRRANEDGVPFLPSISRGRMGGAQQMSHRPVFPGINEHHGDEDGFGGDMNYRNNYFVNNSPSAYQQPLPAPTPQRTNGMLMAAHLESNGMQGSRRSMHRRSQSDVGGFAASRLCYSVSPSYSMDQSRPFQQQDSQSDFGYGGIPPQHKEEPAMTYSPRSVDPDMRMGNISGHQRHQSTPMATRYSDNPYGARDHSQSFQQPQGIRQYSQNVFGLPRMNQAQADMYETAKARALFDERR